MSARATGRQFSYYIGSMVYAKFRLALLALSLFALVLPLSAQFRVEGRVINVTDGDTFNLRIGEKNFRVRLHGIDASERGQAYGTKARDFLADGIAGKIVRILVLDIDRYGRMIAEVFTGTTNWNLELLRAGYAWHYTEYDKSAGYAAAEQTARQLRRGLWAEARPVAPWDFRKGQ